MALLHPPTSLKSLDRDTQEFMMGNNDEEASTKKKFANGKEKVEAEATVAKDKGMIQSPEKKEKKAVANGASLCSRLVFFVLLASLALTISLFRLDYKKGQLQELKAQLPPEIHDVLEKAENVSGDLIAKVTELYIKALVTVEELSSHVPVGDKTLADILFSKKKPKVEERFVPTYFICFFFRWLQLNKKLKRKQR